MNPKIYFVSLGCDKNLVDSENMMGMIDDAGYVLTNDEFDADIIVVNTCGFIKDAQQESIDTILEMAELKETGNCKGLIVVGCLTQRYREELMAEMPEVDGILGTSNYDEIVATIDRILKRDKVVAFKDIHQTPQRASHRMVNSTTTYAYLKISEGCDNRCTYCIIPKLRGNMRSREINGLIEEAKSLVEQGKKEIILVAQDTTKYGIDLYGERKLPELLRELCKIEDLEWLRLLYCYPEDITDELIDVMASEDKIVKYIDIPIQHINDEILKKMARLSNRATITGVIDSLRSKIPNICIRSTLIVGFPGETAEQFEELRLFVEEARLDRLGVFTYSPEEGTKAAEMEDQIDEDVKESRRESLMLLQQGISLEHNEDLVGQVMKVVIEGYVTDDEVYCGRTYMDAPNVDGMVFVETEYELLSGQMVDVEIVEGSEYDLIGVIQDESGE